MSDFGFGPWGEKVPRELKPNLEYRRKLLQKCAQSEAFRQDVKAVCARDIAFYINSFCFQFNPRQTTKEVGPFLTWPCQDVAMMRIVGHIEKQEDLVIEKSREMGASWLCLLTMDWYCKFHSWKKFLCVSRNADAVDKANDPDSLFWKLDFINEYQPNWLRPKLERQKMLFSYANGSSITGQASTGKAGVGGRCTAMFVDEFSQIDDDQELLDRTADTTSCRIFNFTHTGLHTSAFDLCSRSDVGKLVLHWSDHPAKGAGAYHYDSQKNKIIPHDPHYHYPPDFQFVTDGRPAGGPFPGLRSPWYDEQCRRRNNPRAIAMDLDINPQGSSSQFFDPLVIRRLIIDYATDPVWIGDLRYNENTGRPFELVRHSSGLIKMWQMPDYKGKMPLGFYGIGCDIAAGTGATPSCVSVINMESKEKILQYQNAIISPEPFAAFVVALCWLFKSPDGQGAMLAWESAGGVGGAFSKTVLALGYENFYTHRAENSVKNRTTSLPGWNPTVVTKRVLLEQYRQALQTGRVLNRAKDALEDCLQFAYVGRGEVEATRKTVNDDPSGAGVNHADQVIADALAWKMANEMFASRPTSLEGKAPMRVGSLAWRQELWRIDERRNREVWQ